MKTCNSPYVQGVVLAINIGLRAPLDDTAKKSPTTDSTNNGPV